MEKYYNLKEKNLPESFGSVIKLKEGKLEVFVGDNDLENFEITLNRKKDEIAKVNKKYNLKEISRSKSYKLKEGENNWEFQYAWVAGII